MPGALFWDQDVSQLNANQPAGTPGAARHLLNAFGYPSSKASQHDVSLDRKDFELLLLDILARFVNLPAREISKEIGDALSRVCEFLRLEAADVWSNSGPDRDTFAVRYHSSASSDLDPSARVAEVPTDTDSKSLFPWITAQIERGKTVAFSKIEELLPEATQDREMLSRSGTRSGVFIPFLVGGKVGGLVSFRMVSRERAWPKPLVRRLEFATEVFANAIARQSSELALEGSNKQIVDLKAALDQHAIIDITDAGGKITSVNDKFCAISKYTPTELVGQGHQLSNSGYHSKEFFQDLWKTISEGRVWHGEINNRAKDGSTYWVATTIVPLLNKGLKIREYLAIRADITERKHAEELIRESEERFRAVADSAPVLIWMSGTDKLCTFLNKPWLDFTGRTCQQELGNGWSEGVHPDDFQSCFQTYVSAFDARQPFRMEYRLRRHDGQYRWILDNGVPRFGLDGTFTGYVGSCVDITEKKVAEEALIKSYEEIKRLKAQLEAETHYLRAEIKVSKTHGEIIGCSRAIQKVLNQVEKVAPVESAVLITGETGTGKELVAREIHRLSAHRDRPMVLVNCAALPAPLVESELFGRERGAYTGALTCQIGRFEVANGSTIFLDEVGELSMEVQAKLLRVLQEGEFQRLGSPKTHKVTVRVIAATNRDLATQVRQGKFREDLYYRLRVFPIEIPPLRERVEDIPSLVFAFMEQFSARMGKKISKVPNKAMEGLQKHPWPGNIRELRNVIEHSLILSSGDTLNLSVLGEAPTRDTPSLTLADAERDHIMKTLETTSWRIKGPHGAAHRLDMQPSTLYSRMQKLGIPHRRQKYDTDPDGLTQPSRLRV